MKDELSRRQMLSRIAGTLGALLAAPIVVSCAESGSNGDLTVTGGSDNGHTHRFTITAAELASPTTINSR